jgi:phosphohistidine swiveling domain-containing protein
MTPFTWSLIQQGALGNWIQFQGRRPFGNIGGRPYFNISVFASLFHLSGKSDREVLELIEGTLHLRLSEGMEIPILSSSKWALLTIIPRMAAIQWRQTQDVRSLPAFLEANPSWCREMQQKMQDTRTAARLASLWSEGIWPYSAKAWSAYLSSTNHHVGHTTPLRRKLTALVGADDADALISGLSSESELLTSLGPVVGLSKVARGEMTQEAYLEQYGHRGPHEFEFSIPRPAEDPAWLARQLPEVEKSPLDVETLLAKQRVDFESAWRRLRERYPRKAKALRRQIDQIAPRARLREATRAEFARITWIFRRWALRAGELTGLGDDIFFLTTAEVLDLLSGKDTATAHIPARRETHMSYVALPPYPPVIKGRFDPFQWAADPNRHADIFDSHTPLSAPGSDDTDSRRITGAAGAAGRVEGLVRRLDSPEEGAQLRRGEILVTAQTNIGWTILFPRAAGIVTDVGAPLSHAAIVARELGIPAVVGCGDATMRLKTGDRVRVHGGKGVVEILDVA